jgi:hypothetical protein
LFSGLLDEVTTLAAATRHQDPAIGLAAVAALRSMVDVLEALQVDNARAQSWTWPAIADRLTVTKQAVHKKYGRSYRRRAVNRDA